VVCAGFAESSAARRVVLSAAAARRPAVAGGGGANKMSAAAAFGGVSKLFKDARFNHYQFYDLTPSNLSRNIV